MNLPQTEEDADAPQWLKVAWFWSGDSDVPHENLFLEVQRGQLTAITPKAPARFLDLQGAAIIPQLVNAHCHLEFSHLEAPLEPALPFADWIGRTVAARRAQPYPAQAIAAGLRESTAAGVGLLGEVMTHDSLEAYAQPEAPALTLFREFLAFSEDQAAEQRGLLRRFLADRAPGARLGISPHAPYTVCPDDLRKCLDMAVEFQATVMLHLAETRAERELLAEGRGELVEMLRRLNLWEARRYPRGLRPLDYLRELARAPRALVAHGNYFDREEIETLARTGIAVAYCPRTHAFFQHSAHPFRAMLQQGVGVCLGTDGRGSNPDLNLWEEVRFLRRKYPDVPPVELLRMATVRGGAALGQDVVLREGQPARWTVLLPGVGQRAIISDWDALFSRQTDREFVMLKGLASRSG
ncbi:MAG: amidohydrolase family protein [Planctomycetaceae bacterium]|nr:amidohydrolase family protein [Planctomycetaceae bacterium]